MTENLLPQQDRGEKAELMRALMDIEAEREKRKNQFQFSKWFPPEDTFVDGKTWYSRLKYKGAMEFFDSGSKHSIRMFMAANQAGKTSTAAYELVCHVTGLYPDWWTGRRITGPNRWWVAGETNKDVKEIMQDRLLGPIDSRGTGLIPGWAIDFNSMVDTEKADTPIPTIRVQHYDSNGNTDGFSSIQFKSYEAGRRSFQGLPRNIWLDEEPPFDIYGECVARLTSDDNLMMMMTFTPLGGNSQLIKHFLPGGERNNGPVLVDGKPSGRYYVRVEDTEVPHISDAKRAQNERDYPEFQKDARRRGLPVLGSGVIYPVPESDFVISPDIFKDGVPGYFKQCFGMDVGWNWTAVVWCAIDPNTGVKYIWSDHKMSQTEPTGHAELIRLRGKWIPGVIDSAANGRGQDGGESLVNQYRALGLTISNANKSVEAGIYAVWTAFKSGHLKITANCLALLDELRQYQRDEKGKIIKSNDHLCDALRYLVMSGSDVAATELATSGQPYSRHQVSSQYRGVYR